MRCHSSKVVQQYGVLGRTVLLGLPLGQEAKRQKIQSEELYPLASRVAEV
jgi:hypothetical protein